ncbi:hypothetical protein BD410DRAFT_784246 [Rickenella mellea]|uniref:NAD(+) diphosphatase n=1 Tax=Rickenella mellea TaxID=50990 RepID=A0A4Y7QEX8_9AGAM|nr:hypothetical protein BD410DRAFT_784246 [Rickenella mellea]
MAETHVNFLGGSPLNRLSWLRSSSLFLNALISAPSTRWIIFQNGQPLVSSTPHISQGTKSSRNLARLRTDRIHPLLGSKPYFGQARDGYQPSEPNSRTLEAARLSTPNIIFLGLHETSQLNSALPSSDFSGTDARAVVERIEGTPFFALDVSDVPEHSVSQALQLSTPDKVADSEKLEFVEPRAATATFNMFDAAVFAEARSMLDWNARNLFCTACGAPTYSLWGGWKLGCSTLLPWSDNGGRKPCPSSKGLNNYSHPRTDPVVIMAIVDEANEKILLGRNKKFPGNFYSTLAGFMEPGESFEDAVKREIWEEAGVRVWGVRYHSGQPWPYPANLMVGFYAFADPAQPIRVDLDNELQDARWYTRTEVLAVLNHPQGSNISRREYKKFDDDEMVKNAEGQTALVQTKSTSSNAKLTSNLGSDAPPFRVPPVTAIAGVLIKDWANGRVPELGMAGSTATPNL